MDDGIIVFMIVSKFRASKKQYLKKNSFRISLMANRSETMSSTHAAAASDNIKLRQHKKNGCNQNIGRNKFDDNFICQKWNNNFPMVFLYRRSSMSSLWTINRTYWTLIWTVQWKTFTISPIKLNTTRKTVCRILKWMQKNIHIRRRYECLYWNVPMITMIYSVDLIWFEIKSAA